MQHHRHTPDNVVTASTANGWFYQNSMKFGAILPLWTHRRFQFVRNHIPEGMTIGAFLMSILDDAIATEEDARAENSPREALIDIVLCEVGHDRAKAKSIIDRIFPNAIEKG